MMTKQHREVNLTKSLDEWWRWFSSQWLVTICPIHWLRHQNLSWISDVRQSFCLHQLEIVELFGHFQSWDTHMWHASLSKVTFAGENPWEAVHLFTIMVAQYPSVSISISIICRFISDPNNFPTKNYGTKWLIFDLIFGAAGCLFKPHPSKMVRSW